MGELSAVHWLIVLLVILLFFGGRKLPGLMRGLGEGIRDFREAIGGSTTEKTAGHVVEKRGDVSR